MGIAGFVFRWGKALVAPFAALARLLKAERDRWPLWLPVALGTGAAAYFVLPAEPPAVAGWSALSAGLAAAALAASGRGRVPLALLGALLIGFGLARLRAEAVATPIPPAAIAHLTGRVDAVEPRGTGVRLILSEVRSGAFVAPPRRVRLALRSGPVPRPGDWVSLTASMMPPPAPVAPGAADFGRSVYFQSIGAVGFVYGRARPVIAPGPPALAARIGLRVEDLRERMTARIHAVLPGSIGAIAAALITGMRGGIADEDEAALRDAGLAHVLAIAGLHMALVGGGLFWVIRLVLAAFPPLVLNWPVKKWAAAAAFAASAFYLVISGAAPPAVRAFVMLAAAMLAILLDRPAISMRGLALAASVLLLLRPETVTEPGFQMSFAAVAGLVAVAEWESRRPRAAPRGRLYRYIHGIAVTSLVGSLATTPFALFHFGRAAHYAVLGNLIAMPVMGLWVMPSAALSVMLMPFGLDGPALHALGRGIAVMLAMGRFVSGLPGAVSLTPAMPLAALVAVSLGGLWLAIWRGAVRWWGIAPALLGAVLAFTARPPDMLVAGDARTVAVRGEDGLLHFLRPPRDRFAAAEWLRRDGDARDLKDAVGMEGLSCDGLGCTVTAKGVRIAASLRPAALAEDCTRAAVVVTAARETCEGPAVMLDARRAAAGEGWAIDLRPAPKAVSVRDVRGTRPWVPVSR